MKGKVAWAHKNIEVYRETQGEMLSDLLQRGYKFKACLPTLAPKSPTLAQNFQMENRKIISL